MNSQARFERLDLWLCLSSAAALSSVFTFPFLEQLVWVSLVPWLIAVFRKEGNGMRGLLLGLWFGLPFCVLAFVHTVSIHPLNWRGLSQWQSLLVAVGLNWLALSVITSVGYVLLGGVLGVSKLQGWSRIWLPPCAWMCVEFGLYVGWFQIPYATLSLSQSHFPPLLQLASVGGSPLVGGVIVLVNGAIAASIVDRGGLKFLGTALCVFGVALGFGYLRLQEAGPSERLAVAVVQPNLSAEERWNSRGLDANLDRHLTLSREALAAQTDLIVWPESAVPIPLNREGSRLAQLRALALQTGATLVTGTFFDDSAGHRNAAALVSRDPAQDGWYIKRRPFPIGEYSPMRNWPAWLGIGRVNPRGQNLIPGEDGRPLQHQRARIGMLICFEAMFPYLARETVLSGADVLAIISNDAWYKGTVILDRHDDHAAVRAVETGRSVIRAANTGVSSLHDRYGRLLGKTNKLEATVLKGSVPIGGPQTLYVRWGDWPVLMGVGLLVSRWVRRRRRTPAKVVT